jgi:hypothetical protein
MTLLAEVFKRRYFSNKRKTSLESLKNKRKRNDDLSKKIFLT